jgi:hypothetical protein
MRKAELQTVVGQEVAVKAGHGRRPRAGRVFGARDVERGTLLKLDTIGVYRDEDGKWHEREMAGYHVIKLAKPRHNVRLGGSFSQRRGTMRFICAASVDVLSTWEDYAKALAAQEESDAAEAERERERDERIKREMGEAMAFVHLLGLRERRDPGVGYGEYDAAVERGTRFSGDRWTIEIPGAAYPTLRDAVFTLAELAAEFAGGVRARHPAAVVDTVLPKLAERVKVAREARGEGGDDA